jgi:thiol-disulfide isomerase/thioredoxin
MTTTKDQSPDPRSPIESTESTESSGSTDSTEPDAYAIPTSRRLSLQTRLLTLLAVVLALAVLFWPRTGGDTEAPGGFLVDSGGRPVPIGARMAPVTLVHFWATWCPPCMTEVPSLGKFAEDFGQYRGDFTILMVAVDDDPERVQDFVGDRMGAVLYDPSWDVTHRYGTRKLPETYLVVHGQVVERWIGPQDWTDPDIRQRIVDAIDGVRPGGGPAEEASKV